MTFSNVKELWTGNNELKEDYYLLYRKRVCKITAVRFIPGTATMFSVRVENPDVGMRMMPVLVHGNVEVLIKLTR